jgi:threonine dehydrogenase-like Zn-dependent dehydrogenase
MRVGVYRGIRSIAVEEAPEPVAGPSDVVLEVKECGICGSDLHTYLEGALVQPGQVLGHEFAGEVVEVGAEVTGIAIGDRVWGSDPAVRRVPALRRGLGHLCEHMHETGIGFSIPGAFADRLRIPNATSARTSTSCPTKSSPIPRRVGRAARHRGAQRSPRRRSGQAALVLRLGTIGCTWRSAARARRRPGARNRPLAAAAVLQRSLASSRFTNA